MPDIAQIRFSGGLTIDRYPEIKPRLDAVLATGGRVLIDLSEASYVDSMILGELLLFARRLDRIGGHLALVVSGNGDILRVLNLTNLTQRLFVSGSVEAGLAALQQASDESDAGRGETPVSGG